MNTLKTHPRFKSLLLAGAIALAFTGTAMAHCDSLDGPVIADAAEKDVTRVLKWIPAADEAEVRRTFDMALAVRGESDTAQTVADNYFFETLVRVHRASEGAGFTGIKPLGSTDPSIAAADRALETGQVDTLADEMANAVRTQIKERFKTAHDLRQVADESVGQGREYVESYVQFTHFVEAVDGLLAHGVSDHVHGEDGHGH
ncbi:MAG: DUF6448 family protein [Xanthomonadales bacterium]|nr:DUF6448 family protein [Xanthomonadales bacterium]